MTRVTNASLKQNIENQYSSFDVVQQWLLESKHANLRGLILAIYQKDTPSIANQLTINFQDKILAPDAQEIIQHVLSVAGDYDAICTILRHFGPQCRFDLNAIALFGRFELLYQILENTEVLSLVQVDPFFLLECALAENDLASIKTLFEKFPILATGIPLTQERTWFNPTDVEAHYTCLHFAAKHMSSKPIMAYMLSRGASINKASKHDGATPLHVCIQYLLVHYNTERFTTKFENHISQVLYWFRENHANWLLKTTEAQGSKRAVDLAENSGLFTYVFTHFMYARWRADRKRIPDCMFSTERMPRPFNFYELLIAFIQKEKLAEVVYLVQRIGVPITLDSNKYYSPLHAAAEAGKTDILRYFLGKQLSVALESEEGDLPLYSAMVGYIRHHGSSIAPNFLLCMRILIENSANIYQQPERPDRKAPIVEFQALFPDAAENLIKIQAEHLRGPELSTYNDTLIGLAALGISNDLELNNTLILNQPDILQRDDSDNTPLDNGDLNRASTTSLSFVKLLK